MEWVALQIIQDNLVNYVLGNVALFAVLVILIFAGALFISGMTARFVILFMLPLVGFFTLTYAYMNNNMSSGILGAILIGVGIWLGMEFNNRVS